MKNPLKISSVNWLIAIPLVVMSYHIYEFFETEPLIIRIGLALSFDLLVVAVFYLLKDQAIKQSEKARRWTWISLYVMIVFQLYVNVWAYWELNTARALVSGAIFPAVVGLISYVSMLREDILEQQRREAREQAEKEQRAFDAEGTAELALVAEERPFQDCKVDKELVIKAFADDQSEVSRDRFRGASNWRSVRRWWKKLTNGETP